MKMVYAVILFLMFGACNTGNGFTEYQRLISKEKASGKRHDSIFFDIRLGMTNQEFFTYCWQMNSKGIFTDGHGNTTVLYKLSNNELKHPATMNFYPQMANNVINKMEATFQYEGWAPWNKNMFADSLLQDVYQLYANKWYKGGNPFIKIEDAKRGHLYVKVDGNRRIILAKKSDMAVKADYTDLLNEQQAIKGK